MIKKNHQAPDGKYHLFANRWDALKDTINPHHCTRATCKRQIPFSSVSPIR